MPHWKRCDQYFTIPDNFRSLDFVDRGRETQIQVTENGISILQSSNDKNFDTTICQVIELYIYTFECQDKSHKVDVHTFVLTL